MAGLNQSFEQTFVVSTPVLLAQGTTVDLAVGQLGIFDAETYAATVNPTYAKNKALIFAQGRPDLSPLGEFLLTGFDSASDKSKLIKGKRITAWTGKKASRGKNEIITIGYDGADITKNLGGIDGYQKHLYIKLTGQPITKLYSDQGIIRQYILDESCFDCGDAAIDPSKRADEIVSKINSDKYINKYVRASKLLYEPIPSTPVTVAYTQYTVTVTDDGTTGSISSVQAQYPQAGVKLIARTGNVSTYEIVQLASATAPTAVSITSPIYVPDCPTCPAGYTLVVEQKLFSVERAIVPTTDLTTPTARQTYADTIKTTYNVGTTVSSVTVTNGGTTLYTTAPTVGFSGGGGTGAAATAVLATSGGIKSVTVTAGSGYTNGTYPLVFTGGGGSGAAGTLTVTGGAFASTTITSVGSGYTSLPTVTAPAATGGTGGALTAVRGFQVASITVTNAGTGYTSAPTVTLTGGGGAGATASALVTGPVVNTATFISADNGTAKVLLFVSETSGDVVAKLADTVVKLDVAGAVCTPPTGTTATWVNTSTLLAYQKPLKITVGDDCGTNVLAQIQAAYPTLAITQLGGTPEGNCTHVYQTNILSTPVAADCSLKEVKYVFPSTYKGVSWIDNSPVTTAQTGVVAGVKLESAFVDRITNECTYDYFPKEYDGVHLEASYYNPDYNSDPCDTTNWPITKIQSIAYPHGDGYMVRKQEDRQSSLLLRERSFSPAVREVEGYTYNSRLSKYYDEYTLTFDFDYQVLGWSNKYNDQYRLTIFVEEGQGKAIEAAVNSYIVSTNVGLDPVVL